MQGRLKSLRDLEIEAGVKPSKIETKKRKVVALGKSEKKRKEKK